MFFTVSSLRICYSFSNILHVCFTGSLQPPTKMAHHRAQHSSHQYVHSFFHWSERLIIISTGHDNPKSPFFHYSKTFPGSQQEPVNTKMPSYQYRIIRWSQDNLIFIMEILIPGKWSLYWNRAQVVSNARTKNTQLQHNQISLCQGPIQDNNVCNTAIKIATKITFWTHKTWVSYGATHWYIL